MALVAFNSLQLPSIDLKHFVIRGDTCKKLPCKTFLPDQCSDLLNTGAMNANDRRRDDADITTKWTATNGDLY
jgi:hypothetical protein